MLVVILLYNVACTHDQTLTGNYYVLDYIVAVKLFDGSSIFDTAALDCVKPGSGLKPFFANAGKAITHYVGSSGMKPNITEHESEGQDT